MLLNAADLRSPDYYYYYEYQGKYAHRYYVEEDFVSAKTVSKATSSGA